MWKKVIRPGTILPYPQKLSTQPYYFQDNSDQSLLHTPPLYLGTFVYYAANQRTLPA
jgi:hypothetical protein